MDAQLVGLDRKKVEKAVEEQYFFNERSSPSKS